MTKTWRFHRTGGPDVLVLDDLEPQPPAAGEVRLQIEAVGLNRAEAMYRAGKYPTRPALPSVIGYEGVGTVIALGEGVTGWAIGQRACVLPMIAQGDWGIWAQEANVPARILQPVPAGLSAAQASAVWMPYLTAFAICEVARVGPGDAVLIPAASSSVGIAAIQLANWAGGVTIAATRTSAKAEALKALGAQHVIATEEEDLALRVMEITGGEGARCAFDPVGGPYVDTLARALAPRGILFVYGGLSGEPTPYPHWPMAFKGCSMRGWVASEIWNHRERFERARKRILQGLESGHLQPVIAKTFNGLEALPEANAYLESNQQIGKVVVRLQSCD